jgi:hypothetical protein
LIFYDPIAQMKKTKEMDEFGREMDSPLPQFEFKLKPKGNRTIPDLRKIRKDLVEQYARDEFGMESHVEEEKRRTSHSTITGVFPHPPPKEMYLSRSKRSPPMEMATDLTQRTIKEWTPQDVKKWLIYKVERAKYTLKFANFEGKDLLQIDEAFLRDVLDISSKPDRLKILEEIEKLQPKRKKQSIGTKTRKTHVIEDEEKEEEEEEEEEEEGKNLKVANTMIVDNGEEQTQEYTQKNHQKIPVGPSFLLKDTVKVPLPVQSTEKEEEEEEEYAYYSGSDNGKDHEQKEESERKNPFDDQNHEGDEALPAYLVVEYTDDNEEDEALPG